MQQCCHSRQGAPVPQEAPGPPPQLKTIRTPLEKLLAKGRGNLQPLACNCLGESTPLTIHRVHHPRGSICEFVSETLHT